MNELFGARAVRHLLVRSGLCRRRSIALMLLLPIVLGACLAKSDSIPFSIGGPDQVIVTNGQSASAVFSADGAGVGTAKKCPTELNWYFEKNSKPSPAVVPPKTQQRGDTCVVAGETARHSFRAGPPGSSYKTEVAIDVTAPVVTDGDVTQPYTRHATKTVTVSTPRTPTTNVTTPPPGAFGFNAATGYNAGTHPVGVAIGSFDGSAGNDVAVADDEPGATDHDLVKIFHGNGDGTLDPTPADLDLGAGKNPTDIVAAQLDGAGATDLAISSGSNEVQLFLSGSASTLSGAPTDVALSTSAGPQGIAAGDVDKDGDTDLVTANAGANNADVLRNNGTGTFTLGTPIATGTGPAEVAIGDLDGYEAQDAAFVHDGQDRVSFNENFGNGSPAFGSNTDITSSPTGRNPLNLAIGDVNGNGQPDVLVANFGLKDFSVFLNNTDPVSHTPAFSSDQQFPAGGDSSGDGPRDILTGDFNRDGKMDVATANHLSDNASVFLGDGTGQFGSPPLHVAMGAHPWAIASGTLDGDDRPDLAVANFDGGANGLTISVAAHASTRAAARAAARKRARGLQFAVRPKAGRILKAGKFSFSRTGTASVRRMIIRATVAVRIRGSKRARRHLPRRLRKAFTVVGVSQLSVTRYPAASGRAPLAGRAVALGRVRGTKRGLACVSVRFNGRSRSKRANRFSLLGLGSFRGFTATGNFTRPVERRTPRPSGVKVKRGKRGRASKTCRVLARRLKLRRL